MGRKYNGDANVASNFKFSTAKPLDSRDVVDRFYDLTASDTWLFNGVSTAYLGMLVTVLYPDVITGDTISGDPNPKVYIYKGGGTTNADNWLIVSDLNSINAAKQSLTPNLHELLYSKQDPEDSSKVIPDSSPFMLDDFLVVESLEEKTAIINAKIDSTDFLSDWEQFSVLNDTSGKAEWFDSYKVTQTVTDPESNLGGSGYKYWYSKISDNGTYIGNPLNTSEYVGYISPEEYSTFLLENIFGKFCLHDITTAHSMSAGQGGIYLVKDETTSKSITINNTVYYRKQNLDKEINNELYAAWTDSNNIYYTKPSKSNPSQGSNPQITYNESVTINLTPLYEITGKVPSASLASITAFTKASGKIYFLYINCLFTVAPIDIQRFKDTNVFLAADSTWRYANTFTTIDTTEAKKNKIKSSIGVYVKINENPDNYLFIRHLYYYDLLENTYKSVAISSIDNDGTFNANEWYVYIEGVYTSLNSVSLYDFVKDAFQICIYPTVIDLDENNAYQSFLSGDGSCTTYNNLQCPINYNAIITEKEGRDMCENIQLGVHYPGNKRQTIQKVFTLYDSGKLKLKFSCINSDITNTVSLEEGETIYTDGASKSVLNAMPYLVEISLDFNSKKYLYIINNTLGEIVKQGYDINFPKSEENNLPLFTEFPWSKFTGGVKIMYGAISVLDLYIKVFNLYPDIVLDANENKVYQYQHKQLQELTTEVPIKRFPGSHQSYNPITKKLWYSDGNKIYEIGTIPKDLVLTDDFTTAVTQTGEYLLPEKNDSFSTAIGKLTRLLNLINEKLDTIIGTEEVSYV